MSTRALSDLRHLDVYGIADDFARILVIDVTCVRDQLLVPDSEVMARSVPALGEDRDGRPGKQASVQVSAQPFVTPRAIVHKYLKFPRFVEYLR